MPYAPLKERRSVSNQHFLEKSSSVWRGPCILLNPSGPSLTGQTDKPSVAHALNTLVAPVRSMGLVSVDQGWGGTAGVHGDTRDKGVFRTFMRAGELELTWSPSPICGDIP